MKNSGRVERDLENAYIIPAKAEAKLKAALGQNRTAYIYGITGSGKTALVKHIFRSRSYRYYSAAKIHPEQLEIQEDGKGHVVILDDLQAVSGEQQGAAYSARLKELMERGDVDLILISRAPIPRWLMPLHLCYVFEVIQEKDLCLTLQEQRRYLEQWGMYLDEKTEQLTREIAGGHPLSLRMFAIEKGDIPKARKAMWDYLETAVYDQWDTKIQEFLMETSIVESFTPELAQMITGKADAAALIFRAEELGNFLTQQGENGLWQYHVGMRRSMRRRLQRKYRTEQIKNLYHRAGLYYELKGKIPEALAMYKAYADSESIFRLLVENARKNPAEEEGFALREYYFELPEELAEERPELMAYLSMLRSVMMNEKESRRWYQRLKTYAESRQGSAGREGAVWLAYLDIALPHRESRELAPLLKKAGELVREGNAVFPPFSITGNLPSLLNGAKDLSSWSEMNQEQAEEMGKLAEGILGKKSTGLLPLWQAETLFEKGGDSYEIMGLAEKGRMSGESEGEIQLCFAAVGVMVWLAIMKGNPEYGEEMLQSFSRRVKGKNSGIMRNLEAFLCRCFLYEGKMKEVLAWMEGAPDEVEEFCGPDRFCYLTKARVYLKLGKNLPACVLLEKVLEYGKRMGREYLQAEAQLLLAVARYRMGHREWKPLFLQCMDQAEAHQFVRLITREGAAALELLRRVEGKGKDREFQRKVLEECEVMAARYPGYLDEKISGMVALSENALRILRLQAEGHSIRKIAEQLNITEATVKYHNKETYRKLGVRSKMEAVNEARKRKLI